MEKFHSFKDASEYAKELVSKNISNRLIRDGENWFVKSEKNGAEVTSVEIEQLKYDISMKNKRISELELILDIMSSSLEKEIEAHKSLKDSFDTKVANYRHSFNLEVADYKFNLEEDSKKLNALKHKLLLEADELKKSISSRELILNSKLAKLERLEVEINMLKEAYSQRFGSAEVQEVSEKIFEEKSICQFCGGDGGVSGGCKKCDGTGWVDKFTTTSRQEVVFSDGFVYKPD